MSVLVLGAWLRSDRSQIVFKIRQLCDKITDLIRCIWNRVYLLQLLVTVAVQIWSVKVVWFWSDTNTKGWMMVPQAQQQHRMLNAELGSPGDLEQSLTLLLFLFLCVVFYLVHVSRHQGGSTPSLENKYTFFLVTFLWYILNIVGDNII